ncbi:alpha/beta-hydrolase [Hortaea werneckii]|nr:alpha/beta-hydrolase [Hortaea werneckii]
MIWLMLKYATIAGTTGLALYSGLLGLLTRPFFQAHVVYLHAVQMTWGKDLNIPEIFGFLHNQVTPFHIKSSSGESLYAWHVLPTGLYHKHERELSAEPAGFVTNIEERLSFKLLRDDPQALLVIHMHGAGGTVASGYRCPNYRALSAVEPNRVHVITFDYRGFGRSPGSPSERGIIADAISVVEWALHDVGIPPSRILIFSQSLGTAVNMAVAEYYATQETPTVFAGHILVAPFVDVPTLVSTYSVAGTIPILGPVAKFPALFNYLRTFIKDDWATKDRIASYVRAVEKAKVRYHVTIMHAEDDYDIPWQHTQQVFAHAVAATRSSDLGRDQMEERKTALRIDKGDAGSVVERRTEQGAIREEILKYGLHDVIMGNPSVTLAAMRAFDDVW